MTGFDGALAVLEYPTFLETAAVLAGAGAAWVVARWYSPPPTRSRSRREVKSIDPLSQLSSANASGGLRTVLEVAETELDSWIDRATQVDPTVTSAAGTSAKASAEEVAVARRLRVRVRRVHARVGPGERRGWARRLLGPVDRARVLRASSMIETLLEEVDRQCQSPGART
jgi:hypothetical protein